MKDLQTLLRGTFIALATCGLLLTGCGSDDEPTAKTCDPACAEGEHCEDGTCVPHTMTCDPACAEGEHCEDGTCVPHTMTCDPECAEGEVCNNGTCEAVAAADQCTNEADGAIIQAGDPTGAAQNCGLGCLSNADPGACSMECMKTETGLSDGCSGCYVATIMCTIDKCVAQCAVDPSSDDCGTCQVEAGCISAFYACSGLTPPEPPAACDPECAEGEVCNNGTCEAAPADCDPACADGEVCNNGTCEAAPPADCDPACADGEVCNDGTCEAAPASFCDTFAATCDGVMTCGANADEDCAFADAATCQTWWEGTPEGTDASGATQACYSYHLGVAGGTDAGSADTHCPHAKGDAVCVD